MCPTGLALEHPAADILQHYAEHGCPINTGRPWKKHEMEEVIVVWPHVLALDVEAMQQLQMESKRRLTKADAEACYGTTSRTTLPSTLRFRE